MPRACCFAFLVLPMVKQTLFMPLAVICVCLVSGANYWSLLLDKIRVGFGKKEKKKGEKGEDREDRRQMLFSC